MRSEISNTWSRKWRDEEDGDAAVAQVADDVEELLDLAAVEARGGLVEHEHAGVGDHRPADRDELLDGDGVLGAASSGCRCGARGCQVARGLGVRRRPVDAAARAGLVTEHDVLADRQVLAEVDLLVDGRDAGGLRVGGAGRHAGLPADRDGAAVDRVDAGERLDQRRLAGAVLAHEGVDLAGAEGEVDAVEGEDAREADGDPAHRGDRRDGGVRGHQWHLHFLDPGRTSAGADAAGPRGR